MVISFSSKKIEKRFSSSKEIDKNFGRNANSIKRRVNQLLAADNLSDFTKLPGTGFHLLSGNRKRQMAVDLVHPFRLVFEPACEELPFKENGELDLIKISAITIIEIVDYH